MPSLVRHSLDHDDVLFLSFRVPSRGATAVVIGGNRDERNGNDLVVDVLRAILNDVVGRSTPDFLEMHLDLRELCTWSGRIEILADIVLVLFHFGV